VTDQFADRNARLLQACSALDEHGTTEKSDDNASSADLLRLELKINLLLDVMGRLMAANQSRPPAVPLRFNARGATWKQVGSTLKPGDEGVLEIHLKEFLPEPLRLAGRVAGVGGDGQIKVKFSGPGEAVADLIEKLAFRRHRRQVADQRKPRVIDP
jgi:hypothetical protein